MRSSAGLASSSKARSKPDRPSGYCTRWWVLLIHCDAASRIVPPTSDQVVRNEDLAVAIQACANPDRRDRDRCGDLTRDFRLHQFQQNAPGPCFLYCGGIGKQRVRLRGCLSFHLVAAFFQNVLRHHANVRDHRYARSD